MADNRRSAGGGLSLPVSSIVIALVAIVGIGAFLFLEHQARRPPAPPPPLTGEAKAYVRFLQLADVEMKAHESYLKQAVTEITGRIGNQGARSLKQVDINCVFYDHYGQLILRSRQTIVGRKMGGLAPGEIKNFRLAFDDIPESWNQNMPQLVIAQIVFE